MMIWEEWAQPLKARVVRKAIRVFESLWWRAKRLYRRIFKIKPNYRMVQIDRTKEGKGLYWGLIDDDNYLVSPEFRSRAWLEQYVREKAGGFTYE